MLAALFICLLASHSSETAQPSVRQAWVVVTVYGPDLRPLPGAKVTLEPVPLEVVTAEAPPSPVWCFGNARGVARCRVLQQWEYRITASSPAFISSSVGPGPLRPEGPDLELALLLNLSRGHAW